MNLPTRIVDKIDTEGICWEWTAARDSNDYGRVRWEGSAALAHKVIWELLVGPVPEGLELDHLCRNPPCVNPDHLEPVTHAENIRRGMWSKGRAAQQVARTACANGHEYTEETLYVPPASSPRQRQCRICRLEAKRRYNAKRRNHG